jgi:hypothetical protein
MAAYNLDPNAAYSHVQGRRYCASVSPVGATVVRRYRALETYHEGSLPSIRHSCRNSRYGSSVRTHIQRSSDPVPTIDRSLKPFSRPSSPQNPVCLLKPRVSQNEGWTKSSTYSRPPPHGLYLMFHSNPASMSDGEETAQVQVRSRPAPTFTGMH